MIGVKNGKDLMCTQEQQPVVPTQVGTSPLVSQMLNIILPLVHKVRSDWQSALYITMQHLEVRRGSFPPCPQGLAMLFDAWSGGWDKCFLLPSHVRWGYWRLFKSWVLSFCLMSAWFLVVAQFLMRYVCSRHWIFGRTFLMDKEVKQRDNFKRSSLFNKRIGQV